MPGPPTVLVVEHEADGGLDLMLAPLRAGATVRIVRPYLGVDLPEDADGLDSLVVLGGEMGAGDDERAPWLPATRALIRSAVSSAVPTLGICLGAQLLAAATGGRVGRGAPGLEIGLVEVSPLEAARSDPFLGPVTRAMRGAGHDDRWPVSQYHYDAVTELPPGAELLVTADRYPVQAFRVGVNAYGLQFHPEVSAAGFATWVRAGQASGELPPDPTPTPASDPAPDPATTPAPSLAGAAAAQRVLAYALADSLINRAVTDRRPETRDTLSR